MSNNGTNRFKNAQAVIDESGAIRPLAELIETHAFSAVEDETGEIPSTISPTVDLIAKVLISLSSLPYNLILSAGKSLFYYSRQANLEGFAFQAIDPESGQWTYFEGRNCMNAIAWEKLALSFSRGGWTIRNKKRLHPVFWEFYENWYELATINAIVGFYASVIVVFTTIISAVF
jgi:hypothetical protein